MPRQAAFTFVVKAAFFCLMMTSWLQCYMKMKIKGCEI